MALVSFLYIILLSLVAGSILLKWRFIKGEVPFYYLLAINLLSLLLELCTSIFFEYLDNNLFFYHFFIPIEFICYSFFFKALIPSLKVQLAIYAWLFLFIAFSVYCSLYVQKIDVTNGYVVIVESILILFYSLLYLRHIHLFQIERQAQKNPYFWIVVGVLFYFSGSLFLEGFLNSLMTVSDQLARVYYKAGFVFKYIMCILFMIGILKVRSAST